MESVPEDCSASLPYGGGASFGETVFRRTRQAATPTEQNFDIDSKISYRLRKIQCVESRGELRVFTCGLNLQVIEPLSFLWSRLQMTPSSPKEAIISFYPKQVVEQHVVTRQFAFDGQNISGGESADFHNSGRPDTYLEPYIVAGRTREGGVFWDTHSFDGTFPAGSDRFAFTARTPRRQEVFFQARIFLAVSVGNRSSEITLEAPDEILSICLF